MSEARENAVEIFEHKPKIISIIHKYESKRHVKKRQEHKWSHLRRFPDLECIYWINLKQKQCLFLHVLMGLIWKLFTSCIKRQIIAAKFCHRLDVIWRIVPDWYDTIIFFALSSKVI